MAQDLEQLVLSISADTRQIQRALKKLEGDTNASTRKVEQRFDALGKRVNTVFAGIGRAAKGFLAGIAAAFTVREAQQLIDASTRINNALKVAGLEGEALTNVYDRLFESAQKNAAPLESLVTLYGRAAIVQKELGVTSEELLRFTDNVALALRVAGTDAQSASGALLQLSQALGSGTVRAEEFNSILEGALPIAQAAAAGLEEAGGSVAKLRALVVDGKVSSEAFFRAFEAGSSMLEDKVAGSLLTTGQATTKLENALTKAAGEFNSATGASERFAEGLGYVADAIANFDMTGFIEEIKRGGNALDQFFENLGNADIFKRFNDFTGISDPANLAKYGMTPGAAPVIQSRIDGAFSPTAGGKTGRLAAKAPVSLKDFAVPDDGDAKKRASEYEKAKKAIDDTIASLVFEQQQLSRNAVEQRTYNELKRAGVDISSRAGQQIANLVAQIEAETQTIEANTAAQEKRAESLDNLFQMGSDALTSIADGSVKAEDALKKLVLQLALAAVQASLLGTGPLAGLFGGFNPSPTGFMDMLTGRANGGPVKKGQPYIVGEKRPELFVPDQSGTIVPRVPKLPASSGLGGGGVVVNFSPVIDNRGASVEAVARNERQLAKMKAELPALVVTAVRNANKQNVKFA